MNLAELGLECPWPRDFVSPAERTAYSIVGRALREEIDREEQAIRYLVERGYKVQKG